MNSTKEMKAKWTVIITSLVLTVVLIAELFMMIHFAKTMIPGIVILGLVALVAVFFLVNAMMTLEAEREEKRQAHYDNIYKSEKASYLMLKKKFEEIENKLALIQETSKIPSEEIINAQKGIAKVIINRSKENADAIINSNDQVLERLDEMDETQNTKFSGITKDQRLKLQDMVVQLKDMELRLNQAIMQNGGKSVVSIEAAQIMEELKEELAEEIAEEVAEEVAETLVENYQEELLENIVEEIAEEFAEEFVEELPEEPAIAAEELIEEMISEGEEKEPFDPNKAMSPDDIAALFAAMAEPEPMVEEEPEVMIEPEKPAMPDLSDPNRALSPEEIAALIANL